MTEIATVYAVFADKAKAEQICRLVVERKLAACANILGPCRSIYRWQGEVKQAEEVPALLKTHADTAQALIEAIAAEHSYAVPAIVRWDIADAHPAYAAWVAAETGPEA